MQQDHKWKNCLTSTYSHRHILLKTRSTCPHESLPEFRDHCNTALAYRSVSSEVRQHSTKEVSITSLTPIFPNASNNSLLAYHDSLQNYLLFLPLFFCSCALPNLKRHTPLFGCFVFFNWLVNKRVFVQKATWNSFVVFDGAWFVSCFVWVCGF